MGTHAVHLFIEGIVQGVWYRGSAMKEAQQLSLAGWVRNLPDGRVEAYAEGPRKDLETWIGWCNRGPTGAYVTAVGVEWVEPRGEEGFRIQF